MKWEPMNLCRESITPRKTISTIVDISYSEENMNDAFNNDDDDDAEANHDNYDNLHG